VQAPTKYETVLNIKTAKAAGGQIGPLWDWRDGHSAWKYRRVCLR